uniref:hypothetical protein n=1 Tax=Arthrobacter sp. WCS2018Hpa-7 TaxID=3073632 RepID=UPI00288307C8
DVLDLAGKVSRVFEPKQGTLAGSGQAGSVQKCRAVGKKRRQIPPASRAGVRTLGVGTLDSGDPAVAQGSILYFVPERPPGPGR